MRIHLKLNSNTEMAEKRVQIYADIEKKKKQEALDAKKSKKQKKKKKKGKKGKADEKSNEP